MTNHKLSSCISVRIIPSFKLNLIFFLYEIYAVLVFGSLHAYMSKMQNYSLLMFSFQNSISNYLVRRRRRTSKTCLGFLWSNCQFTNNNWSGFFSVCGSLRVEVEPEQCHISKAMLDLYRMAPRLPGSLWQGIHPYSPDVCNSTDYTY